MRIRAAAIIGLGLCITGVGAAGAQNIGTHTRSEYQKASEARRTQCDALYAPFETGPLAGKMPISNEPITDAMKANEAIPTEQEVELLKSYIAADAQCAAAADAFYREYLPPAIPDHDFFVAAEKPIYEGLVARQISWGKANSDLAKAMAETKARRSLFKAEFGGQ